MFFLVTCKYKKDRIKKNKKRWRHRFPHYKSMGAFCCHRNQSYDPICPKTWCSLFPIPVMLHIKFDQDWPAGFREIEVWKCGRRQSTVYYKLTLWDIGSGELKMNKLAWRHHFPIVSLWEIFYTLKGTLLRSGWSNLAEIRTFRDLMPVLVTCKFEKDLIKNNREKVETSFPPL